MGLRFGNLDRSLCVEQVHAGRLSFRTAGRELHTVAGDVCLVPPHEPWRATSEEIDLAPLTLDRDRVAAAARVGPREL
ncbi:AraC family ligand binding domain-containing protein [Pseudonocardia halophobica]|uniref:AraC family ligand binding domain-containing protein n=1 Tax=Pseudonocardia halophobica TaxID=29401 RepID=UPI0018CC37C3|nr:AraC family ligand binding domain-containing protein [Pseudonocardia halophobica]